MFLVRMITFLVMAFPTMVKADYWIFALGKASLTPDRAFSDQVTNELDSRGLDWSPWTALEAVEDPDSIPTAGKRYVSPNRNFSAQTTIENRQFFFLIKANQTGQLARLESVNFPVFVLAWSPDSKSLVAVVHAPMTSFLKVIHWNGGSWDQFEIDAPEGGDDDRYHVVGWQFKTGHLEATYIVDHKAESESSPDLYQCTFQIDPANGDVSHVSKTVISQRAFILLRNGGN